MDSNEPILAGQLQQISSQDCRELVIRILASPQFARTKRLSEFLSFVSKRVLDGNCTDLKEQEIGSTLFGRPLDYDTSQDNIVRANASELRKRLESYFVDEGATEQLALEIPRGSYLPVFRLRVPDPTTTSETDLAENLLNASVKGSQESAVTASTPAPAPQVWLVAIIAALSLTCVYLLRLNADLQGSELIKTSRSVRQTWTIFFKITPQTDIVMADPLLGVVEDILARPISLQEYSGHQFEAILQQANLSADRRADIEKIYAHTQLSVGDLGVAQRIMAVSGSYAHFNMIHARDYNPTSMQKNNVILIGSRKSNPWADLFVDQQNFVLEWSQDQLTARVHNRVPHSNELSSYNTQQGPYGDIGYCVIAYLPTPSHTTNALLIQGTNSEATNGCGEYITNEEMLRQLISISHNAPPPYSEILLRTTTLKDAPIRAELVTYRTYPTLR